MKAYSIPAIEVSILNLTTVLCASGTPDLGKAGKTSELGGGTIYGD